jgi:hypothetical protein
MAGLAASPALLNPAANRIRSKVRSFRAPAVAPGAVDSATVTRQGSRKRALSTAFEQGFDDNASEHHVEELEVGAAHARLCDENIAQVAGPAVAPPWFGPAMDARMGVL